MIEGMKESIPCDQVISRNNDAVWVKDEQPSRGVLKRRCSENMQQIYRRTPMLKCDFKKVAK